MSLPMTDTHSTSNSRPSERGPRYTTNTTHKDKRAEQGGGRGTGV
jgi:hypothetical protein